MRARAYTNKKDVAGISISVTPAEAKELVKAKGDGAIKDLVTVLNDALKDPKIKDSKE